MGVIRTNNRYWNPNSKHGNPNSKHGNPNSKHGKPNQQTQNQAEEPKEEPKEKTKVNPNEEIIEDLSNYSHHKISKINIDPNYKELDQMIMKTFRNERDLAHLRIALSRTKSNYETEIANSITRCQRCNTFLTNFKTTRDFNCEICEKEYDIFKGLSKNNEMMKKIEKCNKCGTFLLNKFIKVYCHNNNIYKSIFGDDDGW